MVDVSDERARLDEALTQAFDRLSESRAVINGHRDEIERDLFVHLWFVVSAARRAVNTAREIARRAGRI